MAQIEPALRGHPGPLRESSAGDQVDEELNWMLQENDNDNGRVKPHSPESLPPRSHTPGGSLTSPGQQNHAALYPTSPTPATGKTPPPPARGLADDDLMFGAPRSVNHAPDDSGDDGEYDADLTADQKMAMRELQEMKLDLAYAEEEPPEYDVAERVRQLNEELAKEPSPTEHERAIKFQDNPVSLVVPPPDYPSDEEADRTRSAKQPEGQAQGHSVSMEVMKDDDSVNSVNSDRSTSAVGDVESVDKVSSDVKGIKVDDDVVEEVVDSDDNETEKTRATRDVDRRSASSIDDDDDDDDNRSDDQRLSAETSSSAQQAPSDDADKPSSTTTSAAAAASSGDDEKVLVERNGKFELVSVNTLTAEEKQMYLVDYNSRNQQDTANDSAIAKDSHSISSKSSSDSDFGRGGGGGGGSRSAKSRPPRPATATANQSRARSAAAADDESTTPTRRVQSAQMRQIDYTTYEDYGYKSPYGLTAKEKEQLRREQKRKEERQRQKEEQEKERKKKEQDEAEDCFQSWLKQKRREASLRRKQENEKRKQQNNNNGDKDGTGSVSETNSKDSESAYNDWLQAKRAESRRSRSVERAIRREQQQQYELRPRQECDKAYKSWLKKKNAEIRKLRADELNRNRVMRLLARRSRKSQQLAQAMTHAQAFKYVDYYGYRT